MRDWARSGTTDLRSSAVKMPMTPGEPFAASVPMLRMRACGRSLRRKATCTSRCGARSSAKVPCPVSSRGSSSRFTLAPMSFGLIASLIGVAALLEPMPLGLVVAADDSGAAGLDAPDLLEGAAKMLSAPGVARQDVPIEVGAQADRIRGQQERAGPVQIDQCADAAGRVA